MLAVKGSGTVVTCPSCDGAKEGMALVNRGDAGCALEKIPCWRCHGAGEISQEAFVRFEDGRRMKNERLERGESLREAAAREGMRPLELS